MVERDAERLPHGVTVRHCRHDGDTHIQTTIVIMTRAGLHLEIFIDRALDIGAATLRGTPAAWIQDREPRHPSEIQDNVWEERFIGGLVATCGLENVGPRCVEDGIAFPQHGSVGGVAAEDVSVGVRHLDRQRFLLITGSIRPPGGTLCLHRSIIIGDDVPVVRLIDAVTNLGDSPDPVMVQYHCNFGRPIVSPGGSVEIPGAQTQPRDAAAAKKLQTWPMIDTPQAGEVERVLRHEQPEHRWGQAFLRPPILETGTGTAMCLQYDRRTLPWLWQWRLLSEEEFVIGLEPSNCAIKPRDVARRNGLLPTLGAGERVVFRLQITWGSK